MAWLIGIICVVIVIYFWKIFLPIGVITTVVVGGVFLYKDYAKDKKIKAKERVAKNLRTRITAAQRNATEQDKEWVVYGQSDPASDVKIARTASITSNDGLCYLTIQKRINGNELAGLLCPDIRISEYKDIYVKFDTHDTSKKMELNSYSDSDDVYIPSHQSEYSGNLNYEVFLKGLVTASSVAIKIPSAETFWVRFTLKGSKVAIPQLGKPMQTSNKKSR